MMAVGAGNCPGIPRAEAIDLGTDGVTMATVRERFPNFARLLDEVAGDNGCRINPGYRFQRRSMAYRIPAAERFAATLDFGDRDAIDSVTMVDCDTYDDVVMSNPQGRAWDFLMCDLFDGRDAVDTYGQHLFAYGRRTR
jgi:hypothetical protein